MRGLEIGAGRSTLEGYIHTDIVMGRHTDVILDAREPLPFRDRAFQKVYMWGVFEHFTKEEAQNLLGECYKVLEPLGLMEFTVPNLLVACRIILDGHGFLNDGALDDWNGDGMGFALSCLYGGQDTPYMIHKWGWTEDSITDELRKAGFLVDRIEHDSSYQDGTHLHVFAISAKEEVS